MSIVLVSLQKDVEVIGLKFLHYSLLAQGYDSTILFLPNFSQHTDAALRHIKHFVEEKAPLFIGLSLMSVEYPDARELTLYLKKQLPAVPVLWGGIHPTVSPEESLHYADYVCIGEGEQTILDVAAALQDHKSVKTINNLCYLEGGALKRNPLNPLIQNLDDIPFYDHIPHNSFIQTKNEILPLEKKIFNRHARYLGKSYSIMGSRGCPLACSYCCNNFLSDLYHTRKIRRRSVTNIIAELEKAVADNQLDHINFQDDCFLAGSPEYLQEFGRLYKEKIGLPFICRGIPTFVKPEKMHILKEAGLAWISIGLQSGSDRVLKEIYQRNSYRADFLKAAAVTNQAKVGVYYDVILDNPFENDEDRLATIKTLMETPRPCFTQLFTLTFYLGTALYDKAQKEYPEAIEYSRTVKDYHQFRRNALNSMIKIAIYLPPPLMNILLTLYNKNPSGAAFRLLLAWSSLMSTFLFEPVAYFKTIKLSQGGSLWKTLRVLPHYFEEGFSQYINQFRFVKKNPARYD